MATTVTLALFISLMPGRLDQLFRLGLNGGEDIFLDLLMS